MGPTNKCGQPNGKRKSQKEYQILNPDKLKSNMILIKIKQGYSLRHDVV